MILWHVQISNEHTGRFQSFHWDSSLSIYSGHAARLPIRSRVCVWLHCFLLAHLFFSHFLPLSLSVQEMKICSAIINLFHLIPAAPQTLVKPLLEVVMKTERAMLIEVLHHLCPKSFSRQIRQMYPSLLTSLVSVLQPASPASPTRLEVLSGSLWSSSWHGTRRKQWSCSWWKLLWMTLSGAACLWSDAGINTWLLVAALVVVVFFTHTNSICVCSHAEFPEAQGCQAPERCAGFKSQPLCPPAGSSRHCSNSPPWIALHHHSQIGPAVSGH